MGIETMTMTTSNTLNSLVSASASSPSDLLIILKDLKNSVIGNVCKKVEVASDERLLAFLLSLLRYPSPTSEVDATISFELMSETAVILGALANVGNLTLQPLLTTSTPSALLTLITSLTRPMTSPSSPYLEISEKQLDRLLPSLLRALRNLLVSTADVVWGHMWGVGAERTVVGTGLVGMEIVGVPDNTGKGKEVPGRSMPGPGKRNHGWKKDAHRALMSVFEPPNLNTLMSLLEAYPDPQVLLPLYQLLARLVALPSHREALARWTPPSPPSVQQLDAGPSAMRLSNIVFPPTPSSSQPPQTPFIISHLLSSMSPVPTTAYMGRRPNPKLVEAALELLAALTKGQPVISWAVRTWPTTSWSSEVTDTEGEDDLDLSAKGEFISQLVDMVMLSPMNVRIAAASCLTNIIKSTRAVRTPERMRLSKIAFQLLDEVFKLLQSEGLEDKIRLCFILAALVSDEATLQKIAAEKECPERIIILLISIHQDKEKGELGDDVASRAKEATLLALASLAMQHEPTRILIADHSPPVLPHLLSALSSPSYGVRAAGCQLARALSRTISILRTSLVDSGVGEEVITLLRKETESRKALQRQRRDGTEGSEVDTAEGESEGDHEVGDRVWTVEVAATATLCNLIADFSPLKGTLLKDNGLELICELTKSPCEPLAVNALWALKNLVFHSVENTKAQVTSALGWERLRGLLSPQTPQKIRVQAFQIVQNLLSQATASEITRMVDSLGEKELLDLLAQATTERENVDIRISALYVLSNLALGNERIRSAVVGRVELLETLSDGLNCKNDSIKVPCLLTLRHLIESNTRTHRPRNGMIELFQPYQLRSRLKDLAEGSGSLDVVQAAVALVDVLDRERSSGSGVGAGLSPVALASGSGAGTGAASGGGNGTER